jgi:hypothetical protein
MVLPIVMATGVLPVDAFGAKPEIQPDATLLKPYTVGELMAVVKNAIRENPASGGYCEPGAVPNVLRASGRSMEPPPPS